jgi:hypothetical protein
MAPMSREDSLFTITCECCGAKIHVDPVTRSVFYTEHPDHKKRSFEQVVKDVSSVGERAAAKFQKGLEAEETKEARLDELFKKAKKKAEENPDEKPPSVWDYR